MLRGVGEAGLVVRMGDWEVSRELATAIRSYVRLTHV